jgi:hypothetical protein
VIFLHSQVFYTGPGVHSGTYSVGIGALFTGVKRPGREADQSLAPVAEVMNE